MANIKKINVKGTTYDIYDAGAARSNHTHAFSAITGRGEEYLEWGGPNQAGSVSPIGMSLSNEHSANRMAFINGACIDLEYSSNGGSTWTSYGWSNTDKSQFWTTSIGIPIGRASASTEYTTSSRTRMTITAQNGTTGYVYTDPRKLLLNISSSGGMQVLIEYRTGTNYRSGGAWTTFGTYSLSGWSGWNDIPLILGTLGGESTQYGNNWQLRLTFIMTSKSTDYPTTASVNSGRIYGSNNWNTPSNMAATGHLYSFDMSQNVTFPATVNATNLYINGTAAAKSGIATATASPDTNSKGGHTHTVTGTISAPSFSNGSAASAGSHGHTVSITSGSAGKHSHTVAATGSVGLSHTSTASGGASAYSHTHTVSSTTTTIPAMSYDSTTGILTITSASQTVVTSVGAATGSGGVDHTHSYDKATSASFTGTSATTSEIDAHTHSVSGSTGDAGSHTHTVTGDVSAPTFSNGSAAIAGAHTHTVNAHSHTQKNS